MKRAKVGDLFYVKVFSGYKLIQWGYRFPDKGDYIRVFPHLYQQIPEDLGSIVAGPHSYIISFYVSRLYRIGIAEWLGNFPVPEEYPFPEFMVFMMPDTRPGKVGFIDVIRTDGSMRCAKTYDANYMHELPEEYRTTTLLNGCVSPDWLLYLFDVDFSLETPEKFWPGSDERVDLYKEIINDALRKAGMKEMK